MLKKATSPTMPKVLPSLTSVTPLVSPTSPPTTPGAAPGSGDSGKTTTVSSPTMKMRLSHMLHNATHMKTKGMCSAPKVSQPKSDLCTCAMISLLKYSLKSKVSRGIPLQYCTVYIAKWHDIVHCQHSQRVHSYLIFNDSVEVVMSRLVVCGACCRDVKCLSD
ncbi:hypothetical protein ElyMa_004621800 [Elysia marginata]|uniref:Uncharacterized protein n=1 Tax=Elysia marginata TaxID=1093978 RepID=A0AAV4HZG4_9GAST|nr:hypothetical protein ElyMa_004621800 [Elysia marginata]